MYSTRRAGLLLFTLVIGIFLGSFGWLNGLLIASPLFMVWFMMWDEKRFERLKQEYRREVRR